ncbi:MAG: PDR/VanB family oxidoreductase [Dermatophilaceae bacterium]
MSTLPALDPRKATLMHRSTHDEVELDLVVASRSQVAERVVALELRDPSRRPLPAWTPGAHIDVLLGDGIERQYSLCGDDTDPYVWRIAVLRELAGRGGSERVHDAARLGATLRVRGPRNHFPLEPAAGYLFIAGGIGITPLLAMLRYADRAGVPWTLAYGGRTRSSMAFLDELLPRHGGRVAVTTEDEAGMLDLDTVLAARRPGTLVYACGPEPLLKAVEERGAAWPEHTLHLERFSPKQIGEPLRHESFEVDLAVTGHVLTVGPETSILRAVEAAGVPVLFSCTEGTCGTCETTVLEGEVDHRDSILTPQEQAANDTMMICVSRAACPRLVLEL